MPGIGITPDLICFPEVLKVGYFISNIKENKVVTVKK